MAEHAEDRGPDDAEQTAETAERFPRWVGWVVLLMGVGLIAGHGWLMNRGEAELTARSFAGTYRWANLEDMALARLPKEQLPPTFLAGVGVVNCGKLQRLEVYLGNGSACLHDPQTGSWYQPATSRDRQLLSRYAREQAALADNRHVGPWQQADARAHGHRLTLHADHSLTLDDWPSPLGGATPRPGIDARWQLKVLDQERPAILLHGLAPEPVVAELRFDEAHGDLLLSVPRGGKTIELCPDRSLTVSSR